MSETSFRMHPLIVIAATTLILTCLLAIGVMTGIVPSPLTRDRALVQDNTSAAPPARLTLRDDRASAGGSGNVPRERTAERAPVGATGTSPGSGTVAGGERAPKVAAVCTNCGTVTSVRQVTQQGEAGLLGPAAGGAVGGLVGSQIGGGSGKTVATIVGAAGGAAIGTELERRHKSTTHYVVGVRLNDGTTRNFTYGSAPGVRQGDRVRVVDGRLVRDS
ncbi:MAG TPA: glycine zipper 2TM domain-containing protein [Burkholderiales bacterium]|nr:glycine zipper 2TM domain-containing protein [Burkholderiales bacterium]